jgi:hypothetical protein
MNKRLAYFAICFLMLAFAGCPNEAEEPDEADKPDPPVKKTWVSFVNGNKFAVSIYSDRLRQVKLADVEANSQTTVQTDPNANGASFYPVYHIMFANVSIPYDGEAIIVTVAENKTEAQPNIITVHAIAELGDAEKTKPLTTSAYLKIQNYGSFSLILRHGSAAFTLVGFNSTILKANETGVYKISPSPAAGYFFMKNETVHVNFPAITTEFAAGRLYSFSYDGADLAFLADYNLTIADAL